MPKSKNSGRLLLICAAIVLTSWIIQHFFNSEKLYLPKLRARTDLFYFMFLIEIGMLLVASYLAYKDKRIYEEFRRGKIDMGAFELSFFIASIVVIFGIYAYYDEYFCGYCDIDLNSWDLVQIGFSIFVGVLSGVAGILYKEPEKSKTNTYRNSSNTVRVGDTLKVRTKFKFCGNCGAKMLITDLFCIRCGYIQIKPVNNWEGV